MKKEITKAKTTVCYSFSRFQQFTEYRTKGRWRERLRGQRLKAFNDAVSIGVSGKSNAAGRFAAAFNWLYHPFGFVFDTKQD
jgi:hypothetical protein